MKAYIKTQQLHSPSDSSFASTKTEQSRCASGERAPGLLTANLERREQDKVDFACLLNGGDRGLTALIERYRTNLRRHLEGITKNPTDALDVMEETFVRVVQNKSKFNNRVCFSTWLYSIGTHLAIDLVRKRARQPEILCLEDVLEEELASGSESPRVQIERTELNCAVNEALASLPDHLRMPMVLFAFEKRRYSEIAKHLGCSEKAVEIRLSRARQQLRRKLRGSEANCWPARATKK